MTKTTETIARIEETFSKASGQWTGMTWDSLPAVVAALDGAAEKSEQALDRAWKRAQEDRETSWYIGHGEASSDYQEYRRRLRTALAERDLDTLRELANQEEADVEARAERAEEQAQAARDAARAGRWTEAVDLAANAARIERTYGDAPTWGPFEAACEATQKAIEEEADRVAEVASLILSDGRPVRVSDSGHGARDKEVIAAAAAQGWALVLGEPSQVSEGIEGEAVWPVSWAFRVGDRVVGGRGADRDTGRVAEIREDGTLVVGWDSGVSTPTEAAGLRLTTERHSGGARIS